VQLHGDGAPSDVLGDEPLAADGDPGMPGWLELPTGQVFADTTAKAPTPPWLPGRLGPDGFVPSTRAVVR
jgi:hypothetical protein